MSPAPRSPLHLACCPVQVRLAIGYAVQADALMDAESLLRHADLAMYEAKGRRMGEPVAFDALIERSTSEATQIERELRRALGRPDEIHLAHQPIVGPDGRQSHAEALARWTSPRLGEVPPGRFIAVAERAGLMVKLGSKLFALICKDLVRVPSLRVSVNVSSIQLMAPNFLQEVFEKVLARSLDPSRIEIELTESVLVEDCALAEQRIAEMRKAGFSDALDDFGTGFSSLGYLHRMSFDRLTIDRSFDRVLRRAQAGRPPELPDRHGPCNGPSGGLRRRRDGTGRSDAPGLRLRLLPGFLGRAAGDAPGGRGRLAVGGVTAGPAAEPSRQGQGPGQAISIPCPVGLPTSGRPGTADGPRREPHRTGPWRLSPGRSSIPPRRPAQEADDP